MDSLGRPTSKKCPCGAWLSRNVRRCAKCGHVFIGRQWEQRQRGPVVEKAARVRQCADGDFDCIAIPGGGLRLCFPDGEVVLTPAQRQIVATELALDGSQ
jgi:hypothetical protein